MEGLDALCDKANHAAHASFAADVEPVGLEAGDQLFGRQAKLSVVADPSLPAFRCALVQNVMDDDFNQL
jgi:hypothetical protein